MIDQAAELRRQVQSAAQARTRGPQPPRTVVLSGGKRGVGTTTLAVNLAVALASDALRVVLLDANLYRPEVAARCGVDDAINIADVLAGRKTIHEAIQRGPAGLHVVAGSVAAEARSGLTERNLQRLMRQIRSLGPHADWLLVDAGNEPTELVPELWTAADQVLLVTSPDAVAVMDTYALIKTLLSRQVAAGRLRLIANRASTAADAADVHRRIDQSCRRFLGLSLDLAGSVPDDLEASNQPAGRLPILLSRPESPIAQAIEALALQIAAAPSGLQRSRSAA